MRKIIFLLIAVSFFGCRKSGNSSGREGGYACPMIAQIGRLEVAVKSPMALPPNLVIALDDLEPVADECYPEDFAPNVSVSANRRQGTISFPMTGEHYDEFFENGEPVRSGGYLRIYSRATCDDAPVELGVVDPLPITWTQVNLDPRCGGHVYSGSATLEE